MRREFFDLMSDEMEKDKDIYLLFLGLGYPRYAELHQKFPDRALNLEASEQAGLDIATGLALEGKKPFVYTITPFYWRAAETIRTYISHERIAVRMCGAGRYSDYKEDGFSHDGSDIGRLMGDLDIECYWPKDVDDMRQTVRGMIETNKPCFLSLRR